VTDARPVLPTDLLALVSYNGRSYKNEAWTHERLGAEASQNTLGLMLEQFIGFGRGRGAWISVRRQRLQGLVGARRRGGRQAWEIDYLIDATPGMDAVGGLLEAATSEVGASGAERLFLRLEASSDLLDVVRGAGFLPYRQEVLYAKRSVDAAHPEGLREVVPADSYGLYQLYNATTPEATRRSEAATFSEWHTAQEKRWLRHGVQLVAETDSRIEAQVSGAKLPQGVLLELNSTSRGLPAAAAIGAVVAALDAEGAPGFVLLPSTAESHARELEAVGFQLRQEFVSLMRRTTRPLKLPKLVPAVAETMRA
jgi:hypothetical protein